jgi:hypothetical protein
MLSDFDIKFARIDYSEKEDLAHKEGIKHFPTLVLYIKHKESKLS